MFSERDIAAFNALEFEIYKYLLNNGEKIPYMTIRELAAEAHVSTTTILRFCKKLGCKGFSEFKVRYRMHVETPQKRRMKHDVSLYFDFLERASREEFDARLDALSQVLAGARSLLFMGMGNSGVMAQYAARYFSSIGKFAVHVENPMYNLDIENPEDCVVTVFSVSGEGSGIVEVAAALKRRNATVISVTNTSDSPLAKLSDHNISYYVQYNVNHDPGYYHRIDITTQLPVVYIIETLAKKVYNLRAAP